MRGSRATIKRSYVMRKYLLSSKQQKHTADNVQNIQNSPDIANFRDNKFALNLYSRMHIQNACTICIKKNKKKKCKKVIRKIWGMLKHMLKALLRKCLIFCSYETFMTMSQVDLCRFFLQSFGKFILKNRDIFLSIATYLSPTRSKGKTSYVFLAFNRNMYMFAKCVIKFVIFYL